jgi:hypothetical protein
VTFMLSPLGRELASSRLLQSTGGDLHKVGDWISHQLHAQSKAVREEAFALINRHAEDLPKAADTLIWEIISDARSSVSPGQSPCDARDGRLSPVTFHEFQRAIRVALQAAAPVVEAVVKEDARNANRGGSGHLERLVVEEIDKKRKRILKAVNAALAASFSHVGPMTVTATGIGTKVTGREITDPNHFCDLYIRLHFAFPHHGLEETRDVPVNFKAVLDPEATKSSSAINTGGMKMMGWLMLGDAGLKLSKRHTLASAVRDSFLSEVTTPDTDYVLWVWTKPRKGHETPAPMVIPLLGVASSVLVFNQSQTWPHIQVNSESAYANHLETTATSCGSARKALWDAVVRFDAERARNALEISRMFIPQDELDEMFKGVFETRNEAS